jgi:hypothetical protein
MQERHRGSKACGPHRAAPSIVNHLGAAAPTLVIDAALRQLVDRPLEEVRGGELKTYEDTLDALLCAFIPDTSIISTKLWAFRLVPEVGCQD